jgi:MYXO-CTERM domain-containing protein
LKPALMPTASNKSGPSLLARLLHLPHPTHHRLPAPPPLDATAETEYIYPITVAHPDADANVTVTWQVNEGDATITANDKRTFTVIWTPTTTQAGKTLSFTLRACVETACTKQSWTLTVKSPPPECQSDNDCQEGKQCTSGTCITKSTGTVTNPPANEIELGRDNKEPTPGPNIQAVGCACTSTQPPAPTPGWIGMFLLLALIGKLRRPHN